MLACGYVLINVWLCPGVLYTVPTDAGIFVFLLVPRSLFCSVLCYIIIIILFFVLFFCFLWRQLYLSLWFSTSLYVPSHPIW